MSKVFSPKNSLRSNFRKSSVNNQPSEALLKSYRRSYIKNYKSFFIPKNRLTAIHMHRRLEKNLLTIKDPLQFSHL